MAVPGQLLVGVIAIINFILYFIRVAIAGALVDDAFEGTGGPTIAPSSSNVQFTLLICCVGMGAALTGYFISMKWSSDTHLLVSAAYSPICPDSPGVFMQYYSTTTARNMSVHS